MKLTQETGRGCGWNDRAIFTLEWTPEDFMLARLSEWDLRVLDDCASTKSIADKLLGLELIARRIEEGRARQKANAVADGR